MEELGWDDKHRAYQALRASLHALRDRLTIEEVAELGAQLPMLVRGLYFEGWTPSGKPVKERHKEDFLSHIGDQFKSESDVDAEKVARGVFKVVSQRVSEGEIEDVKLILPQELRDSIPQL